MFTRGPFIIIIICFNLMTLSKNTLTPYNIKTVPAIYTLENAFCQMGLIVFNFFM